MLLGKILSLHSLNILALLVFCYLGAVKADFTALNVPLLTATSMAIFIFTSLLIIYRGRKITYPAIFGSRRILILILLAIVATLLTKTTIFLIPLLFAIISLTANLRTLLKYYLFWSILMFVGLMALQAFGIITGGEVVQVTGDGIEVMALSLGFGNPNGAFTYLFSILIVGYILLNNSGYKKALFTIASLITVFTLYTLTLSRTGLLCCLLVILFGHIGKIIPWEKIRNALPILFIAFVLGSIFLAIYHNYAGDPINDLLSNRPYWWSIRVEDGALSNLLGNGDSFASNYRWWQDTAPLDSFFLRIWFTNGLLILIAFFVFFRIWAKGINNEVLVLGTLGALLYAFSEYSILANPGKNVLLLLLMVPIFTKYMKATNLTLIKGASHGK